MKKDVVVMSILGAVVGGLVSLPFCFDRAAAQSVEKELPFAVLHNKQTKEKVAEVTVSTSGLHLKVVGYPQLDLSFQDIDLLRRSVEMI